MSSYQEQKVELFYLSIMIHPILLCTQNYGICTAFVKPANQNFSFLVVHFCSAQKTERKQYKNTLSTPFCSVCIFSFNIYFSTRTSLLFSIMVIDKKGKNLLERIIINRKTLTRYDPRRNHASQQFQEKCPPEKCLPKKCPPENIALENWPRENCPSGKLTPSKLHSGKLPPENFPLPPMNIFLNFLFL